MLQLKKKRTDNLAFTLRVNRESVEKLDYIAEANGRSRNSEINQAIKQHILRFEKEQGKISQEDLEDSRSI